MGFGAGASNKKCLGVKNKLLSTQPDVFWADDPEQDKSVLPSQNKRKALDTQEWARITTGSSTIGSAVHVAGHPLLERNQPIVLAPIDNHLSIFRYGSDQPVGIILLKDISSIHTVVYDDERVPYIEVFDSAAQALQISITKQGLPVTFLVRSMHKVRPIDWYHAIENARFTLRIG